MPGCRYHHFGEGEYDKSERVIERRLKENGATGFGRGVDIRQECLPRLDHFDFFLRTTMQMPSQVFRSVPLGGEFFIATIPRLFESSWKWL